MARRKPVDPVVKQLLGWDADADDREFLHSIKAVTKQVCEPCWELKFCPYGPLVEDFPLPPPTRAQSEEHNAYLRNALDTGKLGSGEDLDDGRREMFEQDLVSYDPSHYPRAHPLGSRGNGLSGLRPRLSSLLFCRRIHGDHRITTHRALHPYARKDASR